MVLIRLLLALLLLAVVATPVIAHKDHQKKAAEAARMAQVHGATAVALLPAAAPGQAAEVVKTAPGAPGEGERIGREVPMSFGERLVDWLGRFHTMVVHFPLAFLPAALLAVLLARRRPALLEGARFLILLGGFSAPVAMTLGWLDADFVLFDGEQLIMAHRWLGTGIGLTGLALALLVWRRPERVGGRPVLAALGAVTLALVVQGWLGGSLLHGVDHMNW